MKNQNNDIPLTTIEKDNSSATPTINNLAQQFMELQQSDNLTPYQQGGFVQRIFASKEEKLQRTHQMEKMIAYQDYEMRIGKAMCEAKEKELQMQIASALSQKRVTLDLQTKQCIAENYQRFSVTINDRLAEAVNLYLKGLKDAELIPNEKAKQKLIDYAEQKFEQDCQLMEDLVADFLKNVYADLENQ